ncbi:glycosyltransferase family 2 protein [Lacticaseibacillus sharpeae]|uniref:glycosyltransferase family 2 protein n=1 Tax=Lacticaseibacillus sharpeae TaxID=1626 RepID=UPI00070494FA|nr:glycosyltransferase family A protein [Lacticaseibacillus sharpeae]
MEPLVTVIIPVYNTAEYLTHCLTSIVDQTYHNLQIIAVDDASSDDSALILRTFAEVDPRITVLTQDHNQGVSAARNAALAITHGVYTLFVDGDDWVEPTYVHRFVTMMEVGDYDLVVNPFVLEKDQPHDPADKLLRKRELTRAQFLDGVRSPVGEIRGYLWNKIFRTSIIERYHLRFDPDVALMEDELFVVEYGVRAQKFCFGGHADYHYVMREGSATHGPGEELITVLPQQIMSLHRVNRIIASISRGSKQFPLAPDATPEEE